MIDRMMLSDPTTLIVDECKNPQMRQADVALTYALAIRDEDAVPVDWVRVNEAIRRRWPKGLDRVKKLAWRRFAKRPSPSERAGDDK